MQILVNKQKPGKGIQDSLPTSLEELWLNDDGAVLWLHHRDFINPWNINWDLDAMWWGQTNHPIHSDDEIIQLVSSFLDSAHVHTPALKSLKLLFYFFESTAWGKRDIERIQDALVKGDDGMNGVVAVSVYELLKRSCFYQSGMDSLARNGQYPAYFTEEMIERGTNTDGYQREQ